MYTNVRFFSSVLCCVLLVSCADQDVPPQISTETYGYEIGNYYVIDRDGSSSIYELTEKDGKAVLIGINGEIISEFVTEEGIVRTVYEVLHDMNAYAYDTEWDGTEVPSAEETYGYETGKLYAIEHSHYYEVYKLEQENGKPYLINKDGLKIVQINRAGTDTVMNAYEYLNANHAYECDESYYEKTPPVQ